MTLTDSSYSTTISRRQRLIVELQTRGLRIDGDVRGVPSRIGGAGPSDHRAVGIMGVTAMVPVHTREAEHSPFLARPIEGTRHAWLLLDDQRVGVISFPPQPRFYALRTEEGIPYWKIARLHGKDVLATTVLQHCVRYRDPALRCQFCAIGESLRGGRTIPTKTPDQLAEVTAAARTLDGVEHVVMTTGTPSTPDRGARALRDCAAAITARTPIPIQAQCEPPLDFAWFDRLREAGVTALGMHLEALDPDVRSRVMPSKAEIPVEDYLRAFEAAVPVFGRGQVSTYLIAGLGDSIQGLLDGCRTLIELGVYPFVVPLVPIVDTPMESHAAPDPEFMTAVLEPLGAMLKAAGMTSDRVRAGCARCGACSSLSTFEK